MARSLVPDLLAPGLALVFCGTAPSRASAEAKAYYAKPGNKFWRALHEAGITPRRFLPAEYARLLELGIGLTDLCKAHCGNDHELPAGALDARALERKILRYRPALLAFTSKNAAQAFLGERTGYGWNERGVGTTRLIVLPSPSGLASGYWSIAPWEVLGRAYRKAASSRSAAAEKAAPA